MKNHTIIKWMYSASAVLLILSFLAGCHDGECAGPDCLHPIDTTHNPIDTTLPPPRIVIVTERGTQLPFKDVPVVLYDKIIPFYPEHAYYSKREILGVTNEEGIFYWNWKGDSLAANTYIGFNDSGEKHFTEDYIDVSGFPPDTLRGQRYPPGYIRFHVGFAYDTLERFVCVQRPVDGPQEWYNFLVYCTERGYEGNGTTIYKTYGELSQTFDILLLRQIGGGTPDILKYKSIGVICPSRDTVDVEVFFE